MHCESTSQFSSYLVPWVTFTHYNLGTVQSHAIFYLFEHNSWTIKLTHKTKAAYSYFFQEILKDVTQKYMNMEDTPDNGNKYLIWKSCMREFGCLENNGFPFRRCRVQSSNWNQNPLNPQKFGFFLFTYQIPGSHYGSEFTVCYRHTLPTRILMITISLGMKESAVLLLLPQKQILHSCLPWQKGDHRPYLE